MPIGSTTRPAVPSRRADLLGRGLMTLAAASTLLAFADGVTAMPGTSDERLLVEGWRTFGYTVFAGLWAILAAWPRRAPGIWELLLVHKAAVCVLAFTLGDAPGARTTAWIDLILVAATGLAYVLCRGWHPWRGHAVRRTGACRRGRTRRVTPHRTSPAGHHPAQRGPPVTSAAR
ncbi:hypothetical protein [Amycolatopsis antarctica]|uniref:hypothetical protein n=1 Tax=Amycolatopsis antarctica TaxID=1854586 RepID=UPI00196AA352|nr:hypothetical protein [Amycolatopsis antarctica]